MRDLKDNIYQSFVIEGQMLLHCGPIFFLRTHEAKPMNVLNNGTFGLVDTGTKKLLVTCAHVWTGFLSMRSEHPDARLAVLLGTDRPVIISTTPVDVNTDLDLATFDMESLLSEFTQRHFYQISKHTVPVVKSKDVLTSVGYLGEARQLSPLGANFGYEFMGISVADVSGPFMSVDVSRTKRFRDPVGNRIAHAKSLGGISGSPAYLLDRNGILRLSGFVTASVLGTVRLTHVACVNGDGTISRPASST